MVPREVLPGRFYMITRRCAQRMFLLRPDEATVRAYLYCLIEAAQRYGIEILTSTMMSNHHHTIIFDRDGRIVEFVEHFHKMLAQCLNRYRGRSENFWSSYGLSMVHLVDRADVIDKLIYVAGNPVKDGLVERVHHWPGFNGLNALMTGHTIHATRPRFYFRVNGKMPAEVSMRFALPQELSNHEEALQRLQDGVAELESSQAEMRARTGKRVLGRRRVLRQSWRDAPTSQKSVSDINPRVAARDKWSRIEALGRSKVFQHAYRKAREALLAGSPIPFPPGTYWLRRFAGVPVASPNY
ncbi:hypothetical protein BH11MYX3_BH11MYX3_13880 [soil metagenome]